MEEACPAGLLSEGRAMIAALAADALAIEGVEARVMWDARLPPLGASGDRVRLVNGDKDAHATFAELAAWADGVILIAPESDGILQRYAEQTLAVGGKLLGPSPALISLGADKHRTAEYLRARGIAVPQGTLLEPGEVPPFGFPFPAVMKPADGCGSQDVRLLRSRPPVNPLRVACRLEAYCPGEAASVAVLCGRKEEGSSSRTIFSPLLACRQHLASDGTFAYLGGSLPLARHLAARAESLAVRAVAALPDPLGYIGVDLVLGPAVDGSQDVVIEINPRLTTSYVGLRQATADNLLAGWLGMASGRAVSFNWSSATIQFRADGQVTHELAGA